MRMLLLTAGSRGDVEPFAALARAALAAGHQVRLGVPDDPGVDLSGIDTASLGIDFARLVSDRGVSALAAARAMRTRVRPGMRRMFTEAVGAVLEGGPDVVVHHPKVLTAAHAAAAAGVPRVVVEAVPSLSPTRAFAMPGLTSRDLGPFNRLTWRAGALAGRVFAREVAAACAAHGLTGTGPAPAAASLVPVSPRLLERPADWPERVVVTGAWAAPRGRPVVDQPVEEFLAGGPFLYAGFGSMAAGDPEQRARAVVRAARSHGLRVLIATGWGGLRVPADCQGPDVLQVAAAPHRAVLPRATVAVHHGGAGTVHAVAAAGVAQVVVPFTADQPFWARTLHQRHLAARPVPARRLNAARLRRAVDEAQGCSATARQVAEAVRAERGTEHALSVVEQVVRTARRATPPARRP